MQDNVEDAIQEVQDDADDLNTNKLDKTSVKTTYTESGTDTYGCDYANAMGGKILWTNSSPSSSFATQTIILSSGDYDFYEVFFAYSTSTLQYSNGFKSFKGKGVIGGILGFSTGTLLRRKVDYTDSTHLLVSTAYNGTSNDDNYMIPLYVIGYKTGTFN